MGSLDLATLPDVKSWLGIDNDNQDQLLRRLISSISGQVLNYISRSTVRYKTWTETRDGSGTDVLLLRNWPVISVSSVLVSGAVIPPALTLDDGSITDGWVLSEYSGTPPGSNQTVSLRGYYFWQGVRNIVVTYATGYVVAGEATTVPSPATGYVVQAPLGPWSDNISVTNVTNNSVMTRVYSEPTASGQYWCPPISQQYPDNGTYVFFADDEGDDILIDYSYTPSVLEQIVIEEVAERYRYKDRIGQRAKSLGGQETVSFDLSGLSHYAVAALSPWRCVVPIQP